MKKLYYLLLIAFSLNSYAQQMKYSRAKIYLDGKEKTVQNLSKLGLPMDHGECKKGVYFISDFSEREINIAKANGYTVDILIDNVSEYYVNQNKKKDKKKEDFGKSINGQGDNCNAGVDPAIKVPSYFHLGSIAGFFRYAEMIDVLDSMALLFPNLITAKQPISTFQSVEGRPIYWLKISDNPTVNESEPQILYTALHHAREPGSLSQLIFFMYYILENYNTDPEIKALLDNTELYFIPCLNPDGYLYNETTDPNGGGMWRKNRRDNNDGTYGIDLNRNYGYNWGYDDTGSSPYTYDNTYRGPLAFSEPETQAMKWFCENHQFRMTLNYHTAGNDLIYPWGYANLTTPDSAVFSSHCELMTSHNHYTIGTGSQTLFYVTNGDADDWGYGEQTTKPKSLSMTPEVGDQSEGFWPPETSILPMCINTVRQNIYAAELIGKYALVKDEAPYTINNQSGNLQYSVQRLGLDSAVFTVSVIALDNWITLSGTPKTYSGMSLLDIKNDSVPYTLNSSIATGQTFRYLIKVNNGYFDHYDTITKIYGQPTNVYGNNCSSFTDFTGGWDISSTEYVSAPSSITDSPLGNYNNSSNNIVTINTPFNLNNASSAKLNFWAKWDVDQGIDYVEVMASPAGANLWTPLCGKYTKIGNLYQDFGKPLYHGTQTDWVLEEISLNDYLGSTIEIAFQLVNNFGYGNNSDGFYFDDLALDIVAGTNGIEDIGVSGITIFQNIPNPASSSTTIYFNAKNAGSGILNIYNSVGELVKQEKIRAHQTSLPLDINELSGGIYFYHLNSDKGHSKMMKMIVLK